MRHLLRVVLSVPALGLPFGCAPTDARQPAAPVAETTTPPTSAKQEATMPEHAPKAKEIVIDNFTFDPPVVTVAAGAEVTWLNRDDVPHTATSSTKPKAFDSGALDTDQKWSHVFDKPGVYEYFCAVHPKMTGRVVVKRAPNLVPRLCLGIRV